MIFGRKKEEEANASNKITKMKKTCDIITLL
jgi:hypothetical protein